MHYNIFQIIFSFATLLGAVGLSIIIYSRNKENVTNRLFILLLALVAGYIISHSIHFVFLRAGDVAILNMSCHSFFLMILITLTFFTWNYPKAQKIGLLKSLAILIPSLILLIWLWTGILVKDSYVHVNRFEAHYGELYPVFLLWYLFLLLLNIYWISVKLTKQKTPLLKNKSMLFIVGLIISNLISFIFGLALPWILGFYFLVEISPLTFLIGIVLFTALAVGKYNMFPAAMKKVSRLSINKKIFLSAVILVPIIILLLEIPIITMFTKVNSNYELIEIFLISIFGGLLVSVSMSFVMMKIISKPLAMLKNSVKDIGEGIYGISVHIKSNDEIGELAQAFNSMSAKLQNNYNEIKLNQDRITLLSDAIDNSSVSITIVDGDFNILEINETYSHLIEIEKNKILGKNIEDVQFKNILDKKFSDIKQVLLSENNYRDEIEWKNSKNIKHNLLLSITPATILNIDSTGYLFMQIDITDKKKLEEQLLKSEKLAALGEMAAVLAHEIKTPLTSIKMNADILKERLELNKEDKVSFSIIQEEINRLNNLVKDVLSFSRQTELEYSKFNIKEKIDSIKLQVNNELISKNINFINNCISITIEADEEKLMQVFLNLIDNSLDSIIEDGEIKIDSELFSEDNLLSIYVTDNGGSNLDENIIFEPFFTSKASGTGLGLSISQKIIQSHNGTIKLVTSNYKETKFRIDIPINKNS